MWAARLRSYYILPSCDETRRVRLYICIRISLLMVRCKMMRIYVCVVYTTHTKFERDVRYRYVLFLSITDDKYVFINLSMCIIVYGMFGHASKYCAFSSSQTHLHINWLSSNIKIYRNAHPNIKYIYIHSSTTIC